MRGLLLAATALLAMGNIPVGAADPVFHPTFQIDAPTLSGGPLRPDIGRSDVTLPWTYGAANEAQAVADAQVSRSTTLKWDPPTCTGDNGGISVTGALTQVVPFASGTSPPSATVRGTSVFHVSASGKAPGERPIKCSFQGKVLAPSDGFGGTVADSNVAHVDAVVAVGFLGLLSAEVQGSPVQEAGPQKEIRFVIKLTNLGNSLENVRFDLVSAPAPGWLVQLPVATTVGAQPEGAPTDVASATLTVMTPHEDGWNNGEASLQVRATASSMKDGTLVGSQVTIPVLMRVRGWYCASLDACKKVEGQIRTSCPTDPAADCQKALGDIDTVLARQGKASPAGAAWAAFAAVGAAAAVRLRRGAGRANGPS